MGAHDVRGKGNLPVESPEHAGLVGVLLEHDGLVGVVGKSGK